jgi:hypothetical protein
MTCRTSSRTSSRMIVMRLLRRGIPTSGCSRPLLCRHGTEAQMWVSWPRLKMERLQCGAGRVAGRMTG